MKAAARIFAHKGYAGTTIRDVASEVGILSGSLYYHIDSKEALLISVHSMGVSMITKAVEEALIKAGDIPWERFEAACVAHLEALLDENPFSQILTLQSNMGLPEPLRSTLIEQRNQYEILFSNLAQELPLPKGIDHQYFRLAILGTLNWTTAWYHTGNDSPSTIAKKMLDAYRFQLDPSATL